MNKKEVRISYKGQDQVFLRKMLRGNKIEGILAYGYEGEELYYDLKGLSPIKDLPGPLDKKTFNYILGEIIRTCQGAMDYLIFEEDLILDLDYIYMKDKKIYLLVHPGPKKTGLRDLLVEMMDFWDLSKGEDWSYLMNLLAYLRRKDYALDQAYLLLDG